MELGDPDRACWDHSETREVVGNPTGRGGSEEWIDGAVPSGENESEQPSMDVGLIDDEDVMSTATGVENRVESRNELAAQLKGLFRVIWARMRRSRPG